MLGGYSRTRNLSYRVLRGTFDGTITRTTLPTDAVPFSVFPMVSSVNSLTGVVNLDASSIPTSTAQVNVQQALDNLDSQKLSVVVHDSSLSGDGTTANPLSTSAQPGGSGILIYNENDSYNVGDVVSRANALFKLMKAKTAGKWYD
jgi:hypothetical protein